MANKLVAKVIIEGRILAKTGLMIGGSSTAFEIGGVDKTVIRHPITKVPYIPGSSLKGKLRSLIEQRDGSHENGKPSTDPLGKSAKLFGYINGKKNDSKTSGTETKQLPKQQPSRVIVRDGKLVNKNAFSNTDLLYTEIKAENSIDRITSEANPRFFERVPSGARFALEITLNLFEGEDHQLLFKTLLDAFYLLQNDYLGAAGSRGNGQVAIKLSKIDVQAYGGANINKSVFVIPNDLEMPTKTIVP